MALIREYEPATRIGLFELDGLLSMLKEKADELHTGKSVDAFYYDGAHAALSIVRGHGRVEYPHEFIELFDQYIGKGE